MSSWNIQIITSLFSMSQNAIKFKDVKTSTDYLTINIQENYATDKTGKKIE